MPYKDLEIRRRKARENAARRRRENPEKVREEQRRYWLRAGAEHRRRRRAWHYKAMYGVTLEQMESLRELQGSRCAICKEDARLVLDHCHATAKIRGLLCDRCNRAIGHFGDKIQLIAAALKYLKDPIATKLNLTVSVTSKDMKRRKKRKSFRAPRSNEQDRQSSDHYSPS